MRKGEKWGESREQRVHLNVQSDKKKKNNWIHKWKERWRNQFFLSMVAIWNVSPHDPWLLSPQHCEIIGNWHPVLNTGYVRPGGPSSAWRLFFQDTSQAGHANRIRSQCWVGSHHRGKRWWARLVRPELGHGVYDCRGFSSFKITACDLEFSLPSEPGWKRVTKGCPKAQVT